MNKMITGAIAGTAGIALLAGGFGTYAVWSDDADIKAGTIQTGTLTVDGGEYQWDDLSTPDVVGDWDIVNNKMVPGDRIQLTQDLKVRFEGKNLYGVELKVEGWKDNNLALGSELKITALEYAGQVMTGPSLQWTGDQLDALNEAEQMNVIFELPKALTANNGQAGSLDLSGVKVTVTQLTAP